MQNIYGKTITINELENELISFANNNSYDYFNTVYLTALFLDKANEKRYKETGNYMFIPRSLIPVAFEAWWILQHNVDSYGCDEEWVFNDDGMQSIILEDCQLDGDCIWWSQDEEDFVSYLNLDE